MVGKPKKRSDATSSKRSAAHLSRLAEEGGKPVRVDTRAADLQLLDELVAQGYAPSRAEAYRKSMRAEHQRWKAKNEEKGKPE